VVLIIIRERGRGPLVGAAGHIAQGIVATAVDRSALAGAGRAQRIEPAQLVGLAAGTVEVLVLRAAAGERALPQLPRCV